MIALIVAHPYLDHSRANRTLLAAVEDLPDVTVRRIYDLYPEFSIDVEAEQRVIAAASVVVWQHPIYWYTAPALLKLWFEKVLEMGWAYGPGGRALQGKRCLWVATTGAGEAGYQPGAMHQHIFEAFVPVMRQTAQFCGMIWEAPLVVHGAHTLDEPAIERTAADYRARLMALATAKQDDT